MSYFIHYATSYVLVEYFLCISIYILYFFRKWVKTKIVCSPFNFQILFFMFVLFIISPYQYNYNLANTWTTISTEAYITYINEGYAINLLGFSILGIVMLFVEERKKQGKLYSKLIEVSYCNINNTIVKRLGICIAFIFIIYVVIKANGVPLLNGNRTFSQESGQFIFLLLQAMVYILAWHAVGSLAEDKVKLRSFLYIILFVLALVITANRTPTLKICYAALIIYSTTRKKINYKFIFKQLRYLLLVLIAGIVIIIMRNGQSITNLSEVFMSQVVYGGTFCDIRDSARVLFGYHNMYSSSLGGIIYLAALGSFAPTSLANSSIPVLSSIAKMRQVYSAGTWTTSTLFGIENHYGLRGGMFCMPYVNFGIVGVIFAAIILGYYFGNCELLFLSMQKNKKTIDYRKILFSYCYVNILFELVYAPSGYNSFWGYTLLAIVMILISGKIIIKRRSSVEVM